MPSQTWACPGSDFSAKGAEIHFPLGSTQAKARLAEKLKKSDAKKKAVGAAAAAEAKARKAKLTKQKDSSKFNQVTKTLNLFCKGN
jgi:hypothetical protein